MRTSRHAYLLGLTVSGATNSDISEEDHRDKKEVLNCCVFWCVSWLEAWAEPAAAAAAAAETA